MNRRVLGAVLLLGIAAWVAYFVYWQPSHRHASAADSLNVASVKPISSAREDKATPADTAEGIALDTALDTARGSGKPPVTGGETAGDAALASLLARMENVLQEMAMIGNFMHDPVNPYFVPDDATYQTYQPRIDVLQDEFDKLVQQATQISRPKVQRFLWQRLQTDGLNSYFNHVLYAGLELPEETALLEEMLMAVTAAGGYSYEERLTLFQSVFLAYGRYENEYPVENTDAKSKPQPVSPAIRRLKAFLEEQLLLETDETLVTNYLELYRSMTGNPQLLSLQQFRDQLERTRPHLTTDQYFDFRIRELNMLEPGTDYTVLLQEMDDTRMSADERQQILMNLASQVSGELMELVYDPESKKSLPDHTRQQLQQYLERHLPSPDLQDEFGMYRYTTQLDSIYLLRYGKDAPEHLYQRWQGSSNLPEQVALLSSSFFNDEKYRQRVRQNKALYQQMEQQLARTDLSPVSRAVLEGSLNIWNEPRSYYDYTPAAGQTVYDENGNPQTNYYYTDTVTPEPAADSGMEASETAPGAADDSVPD